MMKSQNTCEIPEDDDDEECGIVFLTAEKKEIVIVHRFLDPCYKNFVSTTLCNVQ